MLVDYDSSDGEEGGPQSSSSASTFFPSTSTTVASRSKKKDREAGGPVVFTLPVRENVLESYNAGERAPVLERGDGWEGAGASGKGVRGVASFSAMLPPVQNANKPASRFGSVAKASAVDSPIREGDGNTDGQSGDKSKKRKKEGREKSKRKKRKKQKHGDDKEEQDSVAPTHRKRDRTATTSSLLLPSAGDLLMGGSEEEEEEEEEVRAVKTMQIVEKKGKTRVSNGADMNGGEGVEQREEEEEGEGEQRDIEREGDGGSENQSVLSGKKLNYGREEVVEEVVDKEEAGVAGEERSEAATPEGEEEKVAEGREGGFGEKKEEKEQEQEQEEQRRVVEAPKKVNKRKESLRAKLLQGYSYVYTHICTPSLSDYTHPL